MSSDWCLIESDPAVFTELLEKIGVRGVSAEEVLTLDDAELQSVGRVYGLILLHKWTAHSTVPLPGTLIAEAGGNDDEEGGNNNNSNNNSSSNTAVYFARQVVQNACATVALVNILCNHTDDMALGEAMQQFVSFTRPLDATTRGQQVGQYELLRNAHNSFAPPPAMADDDAEDSDARRGEAYHYVALVVRDGVVWMLDGLQPGPVRCAEVTATTSSDNNNNNSNSNNSNNGDSDAKAAMLRVARAYVDALAAQDTAGSGQGISFSLMAIVDDPLHALEAAVAAQPTPELQAQLTTLRAERARGRAENARRRHNYYPLLVALLGALAEKQLLEPIVSEAKAVKAQRDAAGDKKTTTTTTSTTSS